MTETRISHPGAARCGAAALLAAVLLLGWGGEARAQRMTFLHTPPASAQAGKGLELVGNIFGAGDLAKARCRYRVRGGSWKQAELALEYGDLYRAVIPARDIKPPSIEYYCLAFDYFGGQMELFGSQSSPRRVRVRGQYRAPREEVRPAPAVEPEEDDRTQAVPVPASKTPGRTTSDGHRGDDRPIADPQDDFEHLGYGRDDGRRLPLARPIEVAPAPASEPDPEPERDEEPALFGAEDVVTLATGQTQAVANAPALASGVPEEQMRDLGHRSLPEVLKALPGYDTTRDVQGFHKVAVRGIRDDAALLVLYDGHRLNNPYDAKALLNLPTENLGRVEAMRGPGSALYGTGAFLGVVNVVSKRRDTLEAAVSAGSFGSADAHLSAGQRLGSDWAIYGDGSFRHTDGYRRAIERDSLAEKMEQAGVKGVESPSGITDDHQQLVNVGAEIRRAPAGGSTTRLSARYLHQDRGALVGLFDAVGPDSQLLWDVFLADLTHEVPLSSGAVNLRAFFDRQKVDRLFQIAPAGYPLDVGVAPIGLFERTRFTAMTTGAEASLDLSLAQSHRLSLGLSGSLVQMPDYAYEINYEGNTVFETLRAPTGFNPLQASEDINQRIELGAFAQDVWRLHETMALTLGLRLDVTSLPTATTDQNGRVAIDGTQMVPSLNPRLGFVWTPGDGWNFKLLYGRAFRAPTMQELAERTPSTELTQGRFEGNPGLRPATIDTLEAGLETSMAMGENKVRLRGNGFFNHLSDPIMAIDTSGNITPMSNRKPGVQVFGAEAELRFEVSSRAWTFLNYSWFRATDLAAPEGFQILTDAPQYRFNWGAQVPVGGGLNFALLAQLGAERRNNGRSQLEALRRYRIPAYALVGAQLRSEPIFERYEIALTAQNVFQADLADDVPRPDASRMPGLLPREGFGAFVTLRARY